MKKIKVLRIGGGVFVLALLVTAWTSIGAKGDPHNGTWTLDVATSKFSQL